MIVPPRGLVASNLCGEFASLASVGVQVVRAINNPSTHCEAILADVCALKSRVGPIDARLLQTHGAGQWNSTWRARLATAPVWQRLYECMDVLTSFDGLSVVEPEHVRVDDVNAHGEPSWLHRDQRRSNEALADTVQGYLALTDADHEDYSTVFYIPRVHASAQEMVDAYHSTFHRRVSRAGRAIKGVYDDDDGASDYHAFDEAELEWLRAHCTLWKPRLKAGDLLLWCSAIPHAAVALPGRRPPNRRVGLFVAMLPAACATAYHRTARRAMAKTGLTSSHNVLDGVLFPHTGPPFPKPVYDDDVAIARKRFIG